MTKGRKTTWKERIEIVQHCLATGRDFAGTAAEYGVSYNQVYQWVRKFESGNEEA
nr:helix-turn-helix domain-containing protein [Thalassobacillus sp. C254]